MKIATLYSGSYGKAGAEIGLNVARIIQRPHKDVVEALKTKVFGKTSCQLIILNIP